MERYNQISEYLHNKAMRERVPLNGTFELTPVCNMDCRMCYVRKSKAEQEAIAPLRTAEEWIAFAKSCRDRGMVFLLLTGGEPFLRPDFIRILTEINQMGIITTINTNGTLIREAMISDIVNAGPTRFNITLYGASNLTYEKLCGNPKGFTQVTQAIELLLANHIDVKINLSLTPYNIEELDEMYAWCQAHNLPVQATSYMFPAIRKSEDNIGVNDRFTPKEAADAAARLDYLRMGRDAYLQCYDQKHVLPSFEDDCVIPSEGSHMRCRAGGCTFWVTWEGKMLPCGMMPTDQACNVFESGMDQAWEAVKAYTDSIRLPAKCEVCNLKESCKACAAMCVSETGCYDQVPEYRCKMFQLYGDSIQELVEELKNSD